MTYTTSRTLLRQVQGGEDGAWYNFYVIYTPLIRSCGRKYDIAESDLEDLVQNVMKRLFEKNALEKYDPQKGKFRTYFGRIIFNLIMDPKNKDQKKPPRSSDNAEELGDIPVNNDELQNLIDAEWHTYAHKEAMLLLRQEVTENTFQAFQMLTEYNMEPKNVAKFLKLPLRHVYDAKARCLRKLRDILVTLDS